MVLEVVPHDKLMERSQVQFRIDSWTVGQLDSCTVVQLYSCTVGQLDSWTVGQLDSWTVGQLHSCSKHVKTRYVTVKVG